MQPDGEITTGEEKVFSVRRPTGDVQREGQKVYNRAFRDAVTSGCILRAKLEEFMRDQGMWNDEKAQKLEALNRQISEVERRLQSGGFEVDEAIEIAKKNRKRRAELRKLVSDRTELDVNTAEGQADNARFNYFVSACLVYNDTQKPVFRDLDHYLSQSATEQAALGATKLAQMIYGVSDDFEAKYEENKFLREFGLIDSKNRFINEEGHLVDEDNRLINEDGHYVLADESLCDKDGNPIDEDGNYIVERKPFLRNGKPVEVPNKDEEPEPDLKQQVVEQAVEKVEPPQETVASE
jgi:hypothetical protein